MWRRSGTISPFFRTFRLTDLLLISIAPPPPQTPRQVVGAVNEYYSEYNANVHRAIYAVGEKATKAYESAREKISRFIGADETRSVVFTRGTTEAINLVAYAWGRHNLKKGDEILITEMEHHSNLVPWQLAARDTGAILK